MMGSDPLSQTKAIPIPTQEEDPSSQSAPLLSFNTDSSLDPSATESPSKPSTTIIFIALILLTCIALSAAFAFAFLFYSSSSPSSPSSATENNLSRPLKKLEKPVVLLVSSDGFRFGYQFKTPTPNIHRLIDNGTEAEMGLIPVFPTLTFPNHYSIVTGLYPAYHGIINNHFLDPKTGEVFNMASHEPKWWLGEPLWETVVNHGLKAATYFWPGSEVKKGSWNCPEKFCMNYNGSVPFEDRVDTVLSYFDLPTSEIPVFMTLYFEDPDHQGHQVGPDDPEITEAVARIDRMIGRLIDGLEKRGIFEDVTIIMVGDHGMVGTCDKKLIFLEDLASWIEIPAEWVQSYSPLLAIRPPPGYAPSDVVAKMKEGLESGKVENGKYLKVYLKEELPSRLHYVASDRIPPIIGLIEESFKVEQKRTKRKECGGSHGYDNGFFSMRTIFIGHGPQFARGKKVPSFENVQIYNLVHATITETNQPKWWEKNAGPNMIDIHSTQEFLSALSEAGDRLVIVEFYGTWCASCRALFPKLCRTAQEHPEILFLKVNFDENKPMCKSLNVKVLPYFHFYRGAHGQLESFSCSLAKFQKIKDAIEMHSQPHCNFGPSKGVGDLNLESISAPIEKPAVST